MAGADWDIISCGTADGDSECESCISVESFGAVDVATNLLERGITAPEVAALANLDQDTVLHLERSLGALEGAGSQSPKDRTRTLEERLMAIPEAFRCSSTGKLMIDPVVDSDGLNYERRSAAEEHRHPNPYLKAEIEAFRLGRARAALAATPDLLRKDAVPTATRLLAWAEGLCRPLADAADALVAEALAVALELPRGAQGGSALRVVLVQDLAGRRCFKDLAAKSPALRPRELQEALSLEQLEDVYTAARASGSSEESSKKLAAGRVLLAKLDPIAEAPGGWQAASRRYELLQELYQVEPVEDLCQQLAASFLDTAPFDTLWSSLQSLPLPVLAAVVACAKEGGKVPSVYACNAYLVAAQRFGPEEALDHYRAAVAASPKSVLGRKGLINCLRAEEEAGAATAAMKEELATALAADWAFDELAQRFEALGAEEVLLASLGKSDIWCLAEALASAGKKESAARAALAAASKHEACGGKEEAMRCFHQALLWDSSSEGASAGLRRLGHALGREREAARGILAAVAPPERKGIAGLLSEAVQCIEAALSRVESKEESRVATFEQALSSMRSPARPVPADGTGSLNERVRYVEFIDFRRAQLNEKYFKDCHRPVHGRETYWTVKRDLFIYMCSNRNSWAIAQADRFSSIAAGERTEGFAFKRDANLLSPRMWEESRPQDRTPLAVRGIIKLWPLPEAR